MKRLERKTLHFPSTYITIVIQRRNISIFRISPEEKAVKLQRVIYILLCQTEEKLFDTQNKRAENKDRDRERKRL